LAAAAMTLTGCRNSEQADAKDSGVAAGRAISGAGATFPYPVYSKWGHAYHEQTGVKLNYQSIGSGGGIAQIKAKTVDFGASDAPLEAEELEQIGLLQFPMVMGGVVPVINLPGVGPDQLRLTPELLTDIFLGKLTSWKDPALAAANPDLNLPEQDITVVHRADGSGTTWIFTNYLSEISDEWKQKVGTGKSVAWPTGVGGKGNEGVAAYVQRLEGALGYVEYAYALENKMAGAMLRNHAGEFVAPTIESFQAAAGNADWAQAPGFYMVLTDQPGKESWPITGATFILVYKQPSEPQRLLEVLKFFDWAYAKGDQMAVDLHYVPMPDNVVELVKHEWATQIQADGEPVWTE
jgi:phosphate transport system substrate-binding protein